MLDFTVLDKRLGTLPELRDLINAAHSLGIYVIVDALNSESRAFIVKNHQRLFCCKRQLFRLPASEDSSLLGLFC